MNVCMYVGSNGNRKRAFHTAIILEEICQSTLALLRQCAIHLSCAIQRYPAEVDCSCGDVCLRSNWNVGQNKCWFQWTNCDYMKYSICGQYLTIGQLLGESKHTLQRRWERVHIYSYLTLEICSWVFNIEIPQSWKPVVISFS